MVILRNCLSGFCYAGETSWVNDRDRALDLGTVEDAVEAGRRVGFGAMEVVVTYDDPLCEMVFPLKPREDMTCRSRKRPRAQGRVSEPPSVLSAGTSPAPRTRIEPRLT